MSLEQVASAIQDKLDKNLPAYGFQRRLRLLDEVSRKTAAYSDPTYLPAYYWLGRHLRARRVLEIGFRLGLCSRTYFSARPGTEEFLAFQQKGTEFYSPKLGTSNVRDYYQGPMHVHVGDWGDDEWQAVLAGRRFDLVLVNEEFGYDKLKLCLDQTWPQVAEGGAVVVDYLNRGGANGEAFDDFARSKSRKGFRLRTRYGLGLVER